MGRAHSEADVLLLRLLERHEAQALRGGEPRRLAEKVAQRFAHPDLEDQFRRRLAAAERAGAIQIIRGKGETAHLILKVELHEAGALYAHLDRQPVADRISAAAQAFDRFIEGLPPWQQAQAAGEARRFLDAWRNGQLRLRYSLEAPDGCHNFIRAFAAMASRKEGDERDLRTFSRQECGDSKLMERFLPDLRHAARDAGLLTIEVDDSEADRLLGLEKFPHLITLAGPIRELGTAAGRRLPGALHPELIDELDPIEIDHLVTIENLSSFNRYVREAMGERDVVIYTGGWPGRGERRLISKLAPFARSVYHWGDIDMAGARIADAVWRAAGRSIELHMMAPELASASGGKIRPQSLRLSVDSASPAYALVAWLASPAGLSLEQEELHPCRPCSPPAH